MDWRSILISIEIVGAILGIIFLTLKNWSSYKNAEGVKAKEEIKQEALKEFLVGFVVAVIVIILTSGLIYGWFW